MTTSAGMSWDLSSGSTPAIGSRANGFGADANAPYDFNPLSTVPVDLASGVPMGDSPLEGASENIDQMLHGQVPQDVIDFIAQTSAEKGIESGLGQGEAARNLTARDLGQTSLDMITTGTNLAGILSADQLARAGFNENQRQFGAAYDQWRTTFQNDQAQWNETFGAQLNQTNEANAQWQQTFAQGQQVSLAQLTMAGQQMIMQNEQFAMSLATNLTQANSQNHIAGIQGIIDSILGDGSSDPGFGYDVNSAILDMIGSWGQNFS